MSQNGSHSATVVKRGRATITGSRRADTRLARTSRAYTVACSRIVDTDELTLRHMCDITRIPAPSGSEGRRGRWFADRLQELGLQPVTDSVGNVHATTPAAARDANRVVIAAHLDTVFAADTELDVRRDGDRLIGPGISDNGRGLAGLLAIARGLHAAEWPTELPIDLVATVGEEGAGDLLGVKHYFARNAERTAAFIALDGAGAARIIIAGVGSRRLRVTFRGPGGHSWSDWGVPTAIHAAGRAIAALSSLKLPA